MRRRPPDRALVGRGTGEQFDEALQAFAPVRECQRLLVGEVAKKRPPADADVLADLVDGGRLVTSLVETLVRGGQQRAPRRILFPFAQLGPS